MWSSKTDLRRKLSAECTINIEKTDYYRNANHPVNRQEIMKQQVH
jgi:hypothetical protein